MRMIALREERAPGGVLAERGPLWLIGTDLVMQGDRK
jgi:hypothetical protein